MDAKETCRYVYLLHPKLIAYDNQANKQIDTISAISG